MTTQKIAAASRDDVKQFLADTEQVVSVLGLQLADRAGRHNTVRKLQQALIQKRQIKGRYSSPYEQTPVDLHLNPIRLCLIKNAWYLIGVPIDADEPRTFRVARFDTLDVLDAPAVIPDDFDLKTYFGNAWAVYRGSETFDVRVRFLPNAARIVSETQLHATQNVEENADGSVVLSFQIDGLEEICNWLLSGAGRTEVLDPPQLRTMMAEKLKAGLELNR